MNLKGKDLHSDLFKRLLRSIGLGHLYKNFVNMGLQKAYSLLVDSTIKVKFQGDMVDPSKCEKLRKTIQNEIKKFMYTSKTIKEPISLNTFFTALTLVMTFVRIEKHKDEVWLKGIAEKLDTIYKENSCNTFTLLFQVVMTIVVRECDFNTVLFGFEPLYEYEKSQCCPFSILIRVKKAQEREFILDGAPRKAYRVGWCHGGGEIQWGTISYSNWSYAVYIQNHALEALEKRIDILKRPNLRYYLSKSVRRGVLAPFEGKYLLEYRMNGEKFGYFVCTFSGSCLVLRTFLFITYDGTPEGDSLSTALNLDRTSKDYMGLEKLSSYESAMNNADLKDRLPLTVKHFEMSKEELKDIMLKRLEASEMLIKNEPCGR